MLHNALTNRGIRRLEERGAALRKTVVENWPPQTIQDELRGGGVFTAEAGRMVFYPVSVAP